MSFQGLSLGNNVKASTYIQILTTGTSLTVHTVCMKFHFAIHVCTLGKYPVQTAVFAINFMRM